MTISWLSAETMMRIKMGISWTNRARPPCSDRKHSISFFTAHIHTVSIFKCNTSVTSRTYISLWFSSFLPIMMCKVHSSISVNMYITLKKESINIKHDFLKSVTTRHV